MSRLPLEAAGWCIPSGGSLQASARVRRGATNLYRGGDTGCGHVRSTTAIAYRGKPRGDGLASRSSPRIKQYHEGPFPHAPQNSPSRPRENLACSRRYGRANGALLAWRRKKTCASSPWRTGKTMRRDRLLQAEHRTPGEHRCPQRYIPMESSVCGRFVSETSHLLIECSVRARNITHRRSDRESYWGRRHREPSTRAGQDTTA